jgi:hypothetical protein
MPTAKGIMRHKTHVPFFMKINPVIPGGYPIGYPPGITGKRMEGFFVPGK